MKKIPPAEGKILTENYSYWEANQYFAVQDLIVIGSGIVGLSTAISFRENNPRANVLVLERGFMPDGASTKNAGFACFGSPGEILSDLQKIDEDIVWETFAMRYKGLQMLQKRLGKKAMDYHQHGGYELFSDKGEFDKCCEKIDYLNRKARAITGRKNCFSVSETSEFGFKNVRGVLLNRFEGQVDTGQMMKNLLSMAIASGVRILNTVTVQNISEQENFAEAHSARGVFRAKNIVVAVNGFASDLLKLNDIKPARAQVLVTSPIKDLKIKGTFHFDEGFYYFRNIHERILLGGGRNEDLAGEETTENGLTEKIQAKLESYLKSMILPDKNFTIERRWSGIMGVGREKKPIIRHISPHVVAAVRMGGMGVAIGSLVGATAANLVAGGRAPVDKQIL